MNVVWCLNGSWCLEQAKIIAGEDLIDKRNSDKTRNDTSFLPLYMAQNPSKLAFLENPFFFNTRLTIQQGIFLCPGDISLPFEENLKSLEGWKGKDAIVKIRCEMNAQCRRTALAELHRMNVHRANLFPGLDGFAQSLKQRLPFYEQMAAQRTGQ